ncbi:TrmH family RNA methyltransferase [Dokdonia sp. Hel_I_53]|uniref:TrmH family RNA methyltransferase n=1 Tax=Dokdonia sp. Hel_I_53 TaxID=1566287 RepID=UPI00119AF304|nr:TrmH family RNA methyltransferase [Dokdonia sp. Hel_I_53]TVZ51314.1 SpoU rRNA methylase family protein [Dokdonia sp. Hel_I_53]
MQLTHQEHLPLVHSKDIVIVCDHITSPANMGSIFRLSDAFGVKELIFHGEQPDINSNRLRRIARNTEKKVCFRESVHIVETLREMKEKGYTSFAVEITSESVPLQSADFNNHDKILLIVGNERNGVSAETLNEVNNVVHIKMFGTNSSMNVSQATGIALYEITRV